jgi:uncharacterized phage protein (TIGR01671 family)
MREFKFRAWNLRLKRWADHNELLGEVPVSVSVRSKTLAVGGEEWELNLYTGLNDKNGKEIYEGDIVTLPIAPNTDLMMAQIVWDFNGFKFKWIKEFVRARRGRDMEPIFHNVNLFEVIGNIYENPEML